MTRHRAVLLLFLSFVGSSYACSCGLLSWATCDETSHECYTVVGEGQKQVLNCTMLIPKLFLIKAANQLRHPSSQNKRIQTSLADRYEFYDECGSSGLFKAKQCNNTDVCWCVDSAGAHHSHKGERNLTCEELVDTNWVRVQLKQSSMPLESSQLQGDIASAVHEWYKTDQELVSNMKVEYDLHVSLISLDVINEMGDQKQDMSELSYYMEKDVAVQPLPDEMTFETVSGQKLEMESNLVYNENENTPVVGMQRITLAILIFTVVITLAVLVGLLILFLIRRPKQRKYEKAQTSEMEEI